MPRRKKIEKKKKFENKRFALRKKPCRFCIDKDLVIDYKLARHLGGFLSERGKISPRRTNGNCAYHQRRIIEAIKRARILALIPYTVTHALGE